MEKTVARASVPVIDLTDGRTLQVVLHTNLATTQIFDEGTGAATPDWTKTAMVVTPQVYVSGEAGDQSAYLKNPSWAINGSPSITGGSISASNPYALTIAQNMTGATQYKIDLTAIWVDPVTKAENQVLSSITLTKAVNSGDSILAVAYAPLGTVFNEDIASLSARCDLWRGSEIDVTNVAYKWYIRTTTEWEELTADNEIGVIGVTTNEITIPRDAVLNIAAFKCEITDTDPSSVTHNVKVSDVLSFLDATDPYTIVIEGATQITTTVPTTTLTPYLEKAGERLADSVQSTAGWTWNSLDAAGAPRPTWRGSGVVSGRVLSVNKEDVSGRATFIVSATLEL